MSNDGNKRSSSGPLGKSFDSAAQGNRRARVDGVTLGFRQETKQENIEWKGMSPVSDDSDQWYVLEVVEKPNKYLSHISEHERIVEIEDRDGPFSFDQAVERLAVWELARMMKGYEPVRGYEREDLGKHYFRDIAKRRGFVISSQGDLVPADDILPSQPGTFLRSDLDAMRRYKEVLGSEEMVEHFLDGHSPIYLNEGGSLEEDLKSFGQISMFGNMRFFVEVLLEYAKVRLDYIEEFYDDPDAFSDPKTKRDIYERMNAYSYFDEAFVAQLNNVRESLAEGMFKYFHVREEDWDEPLDFGSREMQVEMHKNPSAKASRKYLYGEINYPLGEDDVNALLFVSARALVYFRGMLKDSPQKDELERRGIYHQADIDDLLNYLDLLRVKFMYTELAASAFALPKTQSSRDLEQKKAVFMERVANLKANIRESADFSPAHERQIDEFIKARTPIYLIDRLSKLPEKLEKAHQFIKRMVLPKVEQLSLELDQGQIKRTASPTRGSRRRNSLEP